MPFALFSCVGWERWGPLMQVFEIKDFLTDGAEDGASILPAMKESFAS